MPELTYTGQALLDVTCHCTLQQRSAHVPRYRRKISKRCRGQVPGLEIISFHPLCGSCSDELQGGHLVFDSSPARARVGRLFAVSYPRVEGRGKGGETWRDRGFRRGGENATTRIRRAVVEASTRPSPVTEERGGRDEALVGRVCCSAKFDGRRRQRTRCAVNILLCGYPLPRPWPCRHSTPQTSAGESHKPPQISSTCWGLPGSGVRDSSCPLPRLGTWTGVCPVDQSAGPKLCQPKFCQPKFCQPKFGQPKFGQPKFCQHKLCQTKRV